MELTKALLSLDPAKRPTAAEALNHPYFTEELPRPAPTVGLSELQGDWHEFESKKRKRMQRREEKKAAVTALVGASAASAPPSVPSIGSESAK